MELILFCMKNNEKKKLPVLFSKKFIAHVFNIPENKISSWGLIKDNGHYSPCLLLKGSRNVVDLIGAEFKSCLKLSWTNVQSFPVKNVSQKKGKIIFTAIDNGEEISVEFSHEDLKNIYFKRCYIPGMTDKHTFL